ncbi:hypothetical protein FLL45_06015 [Aliikangiella marina]|uniref:Uncharacterized protein n=1 Tax=Aliikangiella marina TaxID=1712262 RepID=A0A545TJY2_9GAMM|nr:hypothetical protein [Aliikangiella marina]TQV77496.1 hypothetical protein FLL45_06015 [Aliikangiella marina]
MRQKLTDSAHKTEKIDIGTASSDTFDVSVLMEQTRIVAAEYREATGHALPVTAELARFDAIEKLKLLKTPKEYPFDAVDEATESHRYLIKGRVIFKGGKARQKLGQVSLDVDWDSLLMVIYDADYQPVEIYRINRQKIESELANSPKDKRGSMTVAKYKAIGELVWKHDS